MIRAMNKLDSSIQNMLGDLIYSSKNIYGDKLRKIILYGSYARKNYQADSDIDVALLIDLSDELLKEYEEELNKLVTELGYKYIKLLSLADLNYNRFNEWMEVYPYYKNINDEGLVLYEQ